VEDPGETQVGLDQANLTQERFQNLLEAVDAIVWEAEAATLRLAYVSRGAERILGFSPEEWRRTPDFWADHLHPEDRERALGCERETVEKGTPGTVEYRMTGADGRYRWFRDSMHVVQIPAGKLLRGIMVDTTKSKEAEEVLRQRESQLREALRATEQDITERQQAEETLRSSASRYRLLFEHNVAATIFSTLSGRIVQCNEAAARVLGYRSPQELREMTMQDIHWDATLRPELISRLQAGKTLTGIEQKVRHKDGHPLWLIVNLSLTSDEDTGEQVLQGTLFDITGRKRVEAELAERLRFETLLADLSARFVNVPAEQLDKEIEDAQRRVCECLDLDGSSLWQASREAPGRIGLTHIYQVLAGPPFPQKMAPREYFPWCLQQMGAGNLKVIAISSLQDLPLEAARDRESWRQFGMKSVLVIGLSVGGGPLFGSLFFNTKKAERPWAGETVNRLQLVARCFANALARQRAQEERQQSLEQLRALAARLQNIREEESKRLAREIHDQLGQALTALKVDLSFLLSELPGGTGPWSRRTSSIEQLVGQTIQTVREISSQLRPGMLDHLGLAATVEWAVEDFGNRTGIKCRLELPEEEFVLGSDRATAIYRILQELLTNVARHAAATEVEVQLEKKNHDVVLKVRDNGRGLALEKLSARDSLGILGMRERALAFGGELVIGSEPGTGTSVRVRIPEGADSDKEARR
jgi:PAS domain S-box-containing protein